MASHNYCNQPTISCYSQKFIGHLKFSFRNRFTNENAHQKRIGQEWRREKEWRSQHFFVSVIGFAFQIVRCFFVVVVLNVVLPNHFSAQIWKKKSFYKNYEWGKKMLSKRNSFFFHEWSHFCNKQIHFIKENVTNSLYDKEIAKISNILPLFMPVDILSTLWKFALLNSCLYYYQSKCFSPKKKTHTQLFFTCSLKRLSHFLKNPTMKENVCKLSDIFIKWVTFELETF